MAGGSDIFQSGGFGELAIGQLGDQDEHVDIDSDDSEDVVPLSVRNDASAGARTGAKSMAGSSPAPREVSSASSHGRRETKSQGSSRSIVAGTEVKDSDTVVPKAERSIAEELRTQMSVSARKQGQSKSLSKSVGDGARDSQMVSKRKAEPSTSISPVKRAKVDPNEEKLASQKGDSPSKRRENFDEVEVTLIELVREKRHRKLVLGDDTDDEDPHQESDAQQKNLAKVSLRKDSGSGKEATEERRVSLPGENEVAPFRSALSLAARKKGQPPVSGFNKSPAGARFNEARTTWVTCTKCKKLRKVYADIKLKRATWCCEQNTRDPKYASCSAPQEQNAYRKAGKVPADDPELPPEREARTEEQVTLSKSKDTVKDKDVARRHTVWVKLQVDGKALYWPGLQITDIQKCDSATQKKYAKGIEGFTGQTRLVRLFHPRADVDEVQVVRRSSVKPFQQARLSYMHSSSHPDFVAAVTAADEYYVEPDTSMDMFSQPASASYEDASDEGAGCHVEDLPHEEAESNEPDSEGPETPRDDPQGSLPQTDNELEILEDGVVNQVSVEDDVSPEAESGSDSRDKRGDEAGNRSGSSDKRQSGSYKERGIVKDAEIIQVPIEHGKVQSVSDVRNDLPATGEREAHKGQEGEEVLQGSVEQIEAAVLPEPRDLVTSVDKTDDPPLQAVVVPKFELGHEDVEARERARGSEISGLEELNESGEKIVFDLEVAPTRRLIGYDDITKMLHFQDGSTVSIDPDSLGKELGISSTGRTLHECIHEIGKRVIREMFPKSARSSNGLKFNALDPTTPFSKRLRETWLRESGDEPMPEFLKTRFVAGCIMEERGNPVNWAYELSRTVRQELRKISSESCNSLDPAVLKAILQLLEKQAVQAPLSTFKPVKGEEHDPFCQQCKHSGELLCCDGKDCRKTYHLKCLNPPLEEPPTEAFFCPSCSAEFSKSIGVEVPSSSVGINLPANNESRQGPQVVVSNLTKGGDHQLPNSGTALAAGNDSNIVVDLGVTETVADATIGEKSQIGNTPRVVVDSLSTERNLHHQKMPEPSISVDLRASSSGLRNNDLREVGGVSNTVQMGSSTPLTEDGALVEQRGDSSKSELEEGEISPSGQAIAFDKEADVSVIKPTHPVIISSGVEPPREEEEFPSSDDHSSICEGCEAGGELMYVTTSSLIPTSSSPFLLCDGKGCKVVYHKECLNPPLETVPVGEWYCPRCERGRVEKIWSVRMARTDTKSSDVQGDQRNSEDAQVDLLLDARFGQHPYRVNESDKASGSRLDELTKQGSLEYLVQWKTCSHAHDSWVSDKELEKLASKELARFKKLLHDGQLYHVQKKYNPEWGEPERLLSKRHRRRPDSENKSTAELEWYVKWKGLSYDHCSWESAGAGVLATPRGIKAINVYETWEKASKLRASEESQEEAEKRVKLPMKDLNTQPDWMVRPELLPLQLEALNKLRRLWHSRMNGILVYEASQEKIVMTIMFFLSLMEDYRVVRPVLVVVPRSLIQNWELELNQRAPKLYIVNYSSAKEDARATIRRTEFNSFSGPFKPQIVLSTFDVINGDMEYIKKVEWEALIIDEGRRQRVQKSNQSSYRSFSQIRSTFRLLLLSEPLKSNVEELLQFVNFLGKSVVPHGDDMTQVAELQKRLTGRVLEYIPENRLTEYWVPVDMTPTQLDQYCGLLVKHYPALSRNHRDHQIQDVVTKLRQLCNHPLLLRPTLKSTNANVLDHHIDISGKLRLLHLIMPILKAAKWRILIFSQETKQLDILERYMTQAHGNDSFERVDSDLATKGREAAIQSFNAEGSKRFVLLLKTGVHISFKNVQFLLLYDSDWNPANDMRALHKIHNEGEASSKPLPVLRLYTHLTVEESSLILYRDKQLPPTRATINAKTCQKLLTWGASRIFDRFDVDTAKRRLVKYKSTKAKRKQVLYNAEVVKKLLEAVLCQEEGQKLEGDELLKAILVPRDEPAKLFAEGDHPVNRVIGDSAEVFWNSSLKRRHEDWQSNEATKLGKGQRGKKRVIYDEKAMATAAFNKAQLVEESERRRPKRRKASSEEQEVVTGPSAQVPTGSISFQATTALHSNSPSTEQPQRNSEQPQRNSVQPQGNSVQPQRNSEQPQGNAEHVQGNTEQGPAQGSAQGPPQGSAQEPANHDHASIRNSAPEVTPEPPRSNVDEFWDCLPTICTALDLPEPVMERVKALVKHFTQFPKNTRKARALYEIVAIELAVVWLAAKQLNYKIDKLECISKVEQKLGTRFDNRPQLVGPLYNRVVELLSSFQPPVAPQVPESSSPGASLQEHPPPRADIEPSSRSLSGQASEGGKPVPEVPPVVSQETVQLVEAEALPVQGTTTDKAPKSQVPVVEADAEVVLVGADPRLVPSESLIDQSRFADPDPSGILVSGASVVEQGKGWVLVDPAPDMLVGEQAPVVDAVATLVGTPSSTFQSPNTLPSQRGREAVPGVRTSEVLTSSPLTPTQVPPSQTVEPGRQKDSAARLKEEYNRSMAHVIAAQRKESALFKAIVNQKLEELRRAHDAVVPGGDALYKSEKLKADRINQEEFTQLGTRQRSDRDNLRDLYSKLTFSAAIGEGATPSNQLLESEIKRIRTYYEKFSPLTSSPLQGSSSLNQRSSMKTMPPSPSTTAAPQTSTAQAAGGSPVAPPLVESQQRRNVGRSSPQAIPVAISGQQKQQGRGILLSSPQQRSPPVHAGVPNTGGQQHTGVQRSGSLQTGVQRSGVQHVGVQQHAGVHHTGVQHAGAQHTGVQHAGAQHAGVQQTGVQQHAGVQHTGVQHAGAQHTGVQHAGVQHAGGQPSGLQHAAMQQAGAQRAAVQQTGVQPSGLQHAAMQQAGAQQAGVQHAGLQQAGAQRAAVQQTGVQHAGVQHASVQQHAVQQTGVQHTGVQRHTGMQHAGVQSRTHPQRNIAPMHPSPTPNLQRGGAVASRSLSTPPLAPVAPPVVGHMPRPAAPTTVTQAGNAAGHVYPDVLLKEKEKLSKDLEKSKAAYELDSQRIKAEYDKEAEILHKKYEALLIEQHRSFTKRQQQVQQNIMKVEWNRQLAEALKQREEIATRAAIYAGFSQAAASNQQAPQQIAVRHQPGGAAAAQVHASIPRATTIAGNTALGMPSVTVPPPGTFSTRVSIAPVQHPARFGVPAAAAAAAPQQEPPRYGMPALAQQQQQQEPPRYGMPAPPPQQQQQEPARYGMPAPPPQQQQEAPRYGMPVSATRSEQPRSSSMSGAMAVLAASGNAGTSGNHVAVPVSRVQQESVFTAPPEPPTNLDPGAGSPQTTGVVAPMPPPSFQDPILSIIRNSIPSLSEENTVVLPPVAIDLQQTASMRIQGDSLLNPQSGAGNALPAEMPQSVEAIPDSGARPDELHISEEVEVLLSSGPEILQEHLVANVGMQEQQPVASASMPPSLIYLSDSDEE